MHDHKEIEQNYTIGLSQLSPGVQKAFFHPCHFIPILNVFQMRTESPPRRLEELPSCFEDPSAQTDIDATIDGSHWTKPRNSTSTSTTGDSTTRWRHSGSSWYDSGSRQKRLETITIYFTRVKQLLLTKDYSVRTEDDSPRFLCDLRSVKAICSCKIRCFVSKVSLEPQFGKYLVNGQF